MISFKWQDSKHRQNTLVSISNYTEICKLIYLIICIYAYIYIHVCVCVLCFNNDFPGMKSQGSFVVRSKHRQLFA